MKNTHKGNHSIITEEDNYYDGYDLGCYDERYVTEEMKMGTEDCIKYIEQQIDNEVIWLKYNAQNGFYRKPYNSQAKSENTTS